jgi:hypothetical protein
MSLRALPAKAVTLATSERWSASSCSTPQPWPSVARAGVLAISSSGTESE